MIRRLHAGAFLLLVVGCGGRAQSEGTATKGSTTGTEESGTEEGGTEATGDSGGSLCTPEDALAYWDTTLIAPLEDGEVDYPCVVTANDDIGDEDSLRFDCMDGDTVISKKVGIVWGNDDHLPLEPGDEIRVRARLSVPMWQNWYIRIDRLDGSPVFSGATGDSINYQFQDGTWALPYEPAPLLSNCPTEDLECGTSEALVVGFWLDGEGQSLPSGTHAELDIGGTPDVWITEASRWVTLDCTDTPQDWFSVVMAHFE